ncbi:hypothetical protein KQI63_10830 [bacterium]|nr:hypothetical protein [bacterium]
MAQLLLSIVLFWFLTVYVTQDIKIDLYTAGVWTFLSIAFAVLVVWVLPTMFPDVPPVVVVVVTILAQMSILGIALRYRFYVTKSRDLITILGGFFIGSLIIGFVL